MSGFGREYCRQHSDDSYYDEKSSSGSSREGPPYCAVPGCLTVPHYHCQHCNFAWAKKVILHCPECGKFPFDGTHYHGDGRRWSASEGISPYG